jgi:hypothetical protein
MVNTNSLYDITRKRGSKQLTQKDLIFDDIPDNSSKEFVSTKELIRVHGLSKSHLNSILSRLRRDNLIITIKCSTDYSQQYHQRT